MVDVAAAEAANQGMYREITLRSGGRVSETDGVCVLIGVHPSWIIVNIGFRAHPSAPANLVIERCDRELTSLGRRPVIMTFARPDADLEVALEAAGWEAVLDLPVMARATPLAKPEPPADVSIRWLDPDIDADRLVLREVVGRGDSAEWQEIVDSVFSRPASIRPPGNSAVLVTRDGEPVAAATIYRVGPAGVVSWVATVPDARRQGLGRLVSTLVTNRAFELGADWATLQASDMGEPVYRAMGYQVLTTSRIWLGPSAKGASAGQAEAEANARSSELERS